MMVDLTKEIIDKLKEYGFGSTRVSHKHFSRKKDGNVEFVDLRGIEPKISVKVDGRNIKHTPKNLRLSAALKKLKEELTEMIQDE